MRVELKAGLVVDGMLKGVIAEQGPPYPHIVVELAVTKSDETATVTFDQNDLFAIVRLATASKVQGIKDAVR